MSRPIIATQFAILFGLITVFVVQHAEAEVTGWLTWRGPEQNGRSRETALPDTIETDGKNHLWSYELAGRGTPVIANNRVFAWGYRGDGANLHEVLVCLNVETGDLIWEHQFNDFLSDIIYNRYSIGSPTIDKKTGNIYLLTTAGILAAMNMNGVLLWQRSLMEEFGRLTFPNGRTGSPVIDGNLVIVRGITTNWGKQGPARDRFYAFDTLTGDHVWASTPGVPPTDSSFSTPVFSWLHGKRVFYAGTGCGNIVCVNSRTGEPLSRFQLLRGGVNSSVLLYGHHHVIAIHGKENFDSSEIGRMVSVNMGVKLEPKQSRPVILKNDSELWRNSLGIFTSSPIRVGNRIYQVVHTGSLCCIDADSGNILWRKKLSNSQLHASPLFADAKLYVPMVNGSLHILRPSDQSAESLETVQLQGNCLGAPAVWNGRIYVHTTKKLYCFGTPNSGSKLAFSKETLSPGERPPVGTPARLQLVPSEILLRPGEKETIRIHVLDENGQRVEKFDEAPHKWEKFIPPGAKVRSILNAEIVDNNVIQADPKNKPSAGMFKLSMGELSGYLRGRILPDLPIHENFENFGLTEMGYENQDRFPFAFPPLPWIGARFKWEIREHGGSKVLAKTLDKVLFQRAMTFIGHPDMSNYTVEADVLSDGNRRIMSTVGVINQRYIIALKGNWQQLEVSSNHDIIKVGVPFTWKPNQWYNLKARVDVNSDGSGTVRAKAWERDQGEPEQWTIEVPHKRAHKMGSPGLFGFSPQSKKRVYIDNISVTQND